MKQYWEIKSAHQEKIILFRLGDFYEMFFDDAIESSKILQLTLTKRHDTPMCGIPHHALNNYLYKLIQAGKKVALVEQMEEPVQGQIVRRSITQVITPGTVTDPLNLKQTENNYLLSFYFKKIAAQSYSPERILLSVGAMDISTGEVEITYRNTEHLNLDLETILTCYPAREVLLPESIKIHMDYINILPLFESVLLNSLPNFIYTPGYAEEKIKRNYQVKSLKGLGLVEDGKGIFVLGALLYYVEETQKQMLKHLKVPRFIHPAETMIIDGITQRNLELIKNNIDQTEKFTLFKTLQNTLTPMGGRLLKRIILNPLLNIKKIISRQKTVSYLFENPSYLKDLRDLMKKIYDFERLTSRIALNRIMPKEIISLKNSLKQTDKLLKLIKPNTLLIENYDKNCVPHSIINKIESLLLEDPSNHIGEGNIIKPEADVSLKNIISTKKQGNTWLLNLLETEKKKNQLPTLRVKFTDNTGYFFEISKGKTKNIPDYFIKKQSLVNVERYTTGDLIKLQDKILEAKKNSDDLELKIYQTLKDFLIAQIPIIHKLSEITASLDVFTSFADIALIRNYTKPQITEGDEILIEDGRHPVIEANSHEDFIPNSLKLGGKNGILHIITGPNMAGKSTFLRQNALIVLMAQMGAFVPAKKAIIGLCDKIFTRVGASDNISKGESTFLVEMSETANILAQSTPKSLIIMDEVGRGTSTYDGMSLAWAIVEYIVAGKSCRAKTLFATHYHELTQLTNTFTSVKNYNTAVKEYDNELIFLKKVVPGPADRSYGIHVAALAGIPSVIISKAESLLKKLEKKQMNDAFAEDKTSRIKEKSQLNLFDNAYHQIINKIKAIDVNKMSPIEALNVLVEIQKDIG